MTPFFKHFHRSEGRELARCYVVGLTREGERKSVEPMSEKVNAAERSMQRLLTEVKWDEEEVIQEYRRGMLAETSDPQGVLVVDERRKREKGGFELRYFFSSVFFRGTHPNSGVWV